MKILAVLLIFFCLAAGPALARSQDPPVGPEEVIGFARHLARSGQPEKAATEYGRVLYLFPDHPETDRVRLELAESLLAAGQPVKALETVSGLSQGPPGPLTGQASILMAQALALTGRLAEAESVYKRMAADEAFPALVRDRAAYRLGWLYLEEFRWDEAAQIFGRIPPESPLGLKAALLARQVGQGAALPRKSPRLASFLSVLLPGLGQAYTGRWADAGWSCGLTLGAGVLSWLALASGSLVTGGVLAAVALAFYGGNIYNALNNAHRKNRLAAEEFVGGLKTAVEGLGGG